MKRILILFIMMFSITSFGNHSKVDNIPKEDIVEEDSLFQDYMNLAINLGDLITIDPATFAAACITVHYSESNFQKNVIGDNHSVGIWQVTKKTRKALSIPDISNMTIKEQLVYYEKYLRACPKNALSKVKNSIDLHVLHFAPFRTNKNILSKVCNKHLRGLDRDKDGVITREDLKLFQEKRIRNSQQVTNIYDQFFNSKV